MTCPEGHGGDCIQKITSKVCICHAVGCDGQSFLLEEPVGSGQRQPVTAGVRR